MSMHTVCRSDELGVGQMKACAAGGQRIVLYRLTDGFFATQANCPHTFAPLARGKVLEDCKVQCSLHRARFDIRSGAVIDWANFPPGIQLLNVVRGERALRTFRVGVKAGKVRVDVPGA